MYGVFHACGLWGTVPKGHFLKEAKTMWLGGILGTIPNSTLIVHSDAIWYDGAELRPRYVDHHSRPAIHFKDAYLRGTRPLQFSDSE